MEEGGEAKGGQRRITYDQVHRIPGRPIEIYYNSALQVKSTAIFHK